MFELAKDSMSQSIQSFDKFSINNDDAIKYTQATPLHNNKDYIREEQDSV